MPDVSVVCPQCKASTTFSTAVNPDYLMCSSCGRRLPPFPTEAKTSRLKIKKGDSFGPISLSGHEETVAQPPASFSPPVHVVRENISRNRRGFHLPHTFWSWLVFLVLAGGLGYLRYGDAIQLTSAQKQMIGQYGALTILAFHFSVVLLAFKDNVFRGILSLLLPGYSFYYIFGVSDLFMLRAIAAGILVGIGEDSAIVIREYASHIFEVATNWIQAGGGR